MWVTFLLDDKKFVTSLESITDMAPDSMLAMLIRNELNKFPDASELSIRIDRDPKIFRYILQWYRTGLMPKNNQVGLSKEEWQMETDFYLIADTIENIESRKRQRDTTSEFAKKSEEAKKRIDVGMEKEKEDRVGIFKACLEYMMERINKQLGHSTFTFVCMKDGYEFSQENFPVYLHSWFAKFTKFASSYGWWVRELEHHTMTTVQNYKFPPASDRKQSPMGHSDITIEICIAKYDEK